MVGRGVIDLRLMDSLLVLMIGSIAACGAYGEEADRSPGVRAGQPAALTVQESPPDAAEVARIEALIVRLSEIGRADQGLSATMTGSAFAPLPGQATFTTGLITDHHLTTDEALTALVAAGPAALPLLLAHLDDATPTQLEVKHDMGFGAMWLAEEMPINPVSPWEAHLPMAQHAMPGEGATIAEYRVAIGDVCFVIIGQIVGRAYSAVRYQPTACIVINSPTVRPALAAAVRSAWSSDTPRGHLLDSLLFDLATEGVSDGKSLDGWYMGSELRCRAAMRLLYYFPGEADGLVAGMVDRLDLGRPEGEAVDQWMQRQVRSGARTDDLLKAVAWSPAAETAAAVRRAFDRAVDPVDALASLAPRLDEAQVDRLIALLDALPADERGPYGDGFNLLAALLDRGEVRGAQACRRYLTKGVQRRMTLCLLLHDRPAPGASELLRPLLDDQRETGRTYPVDTASSERGMERVCDLAADALARRVPGLHFELAGSREHLDRQIEGQRQALPSESP
jgi:hypothetical protein